VFGHGFAETMAKEPPNTYCTIGLDYAYGRDITKVFMAELTRLKPSAKLIPGCEFWLPLGATDLTPHITAILARQPDAVMFGGLVAASAPAFVKQGKAFGLFKHIVGVHPSIGMQVNSAGLTSKDDIPENIVTGTDNFYPPIDNPAYKTLFEAYRKRWNQDIFEEAVNSYVTVHFIVNAFKKAGKIDREAMIDAAEGMSIDHPTLGKITVRAFDHQSTAGWWVGYLTWDDKHKRAGMRDAKLVDGEPYLPTKEEIEKLRATKK
jgi:branched-chain amino acid transport system substrate-binding protein